uniref:Uncharacterized protein n=1 Tax=Rhizophora mucronata TaxID=61149 RepID=A0A2P2PVB7_RHIMU
MFRKLSKESLNISSDELKRTGKQENQELM